MWSDLTLGPLLHGQMRIAKLESTYNLFIIGPRILGCHTDPQENLGWESFWGRFHEASFVFSFLKVKEGEFLTFGKASLKSYFTKPPLFHLTKDFP